MSPQENLQYGRITQIKICSRSFLVPLGAVNCLVLRAYKPLPSLTVFFSTSFSHSGCSMSPVPRTFMPFSLAVSAIDFGFIASLHAIANLECTCKSATIFINIAYKFPYLSKAFSATSLTLGKVSLPLDSIQPLT